MSNPEDMNFHVSVKGLFFRDDKVLMIKEGDAWEIPGGRIERGEALTETLVREVQEEMGLTCTVLEKQPSIAYASVDDYGVPRVMLYYKVHFDSLDFTPTPECSAIEFFTKEEMRDVPKFLQLNPLPDYL